MKRLLTAILILWCVNAEAQVKKYWIYFVDKENGAPSSGRITTNSKQFSRALSNVTERALARRAKVLPSEAVVDAADLPINPSYLDEVRHIGGIVIHQSKWFNAASVLLTPEQIPQVSRLSFVKKVEPVRVFRGYRKEYETNPLPGAFAKTTGMDYGPSATQIQIINVSQLHDIGITGHNVIVGMLDSGFRWRAHESLQTRRVIAEYDFIFHDDTTANQAGDVSNQDQHGTLTMSTLGGYKPGQLIGPAFDAAFVLAKTEYIPTETKVEEDNWAAAMEWMESLGVDVASSSLGYNDFDPQGPSPGDYTWANGDFNGRTSITAQAAVRAARLGVVVCDAMGNEGNGDGIVGTMLTPADADSIISVGAVTFGKQLAGFSSTGPTNDGRTKPDVVSPGVGVYCASTASPSSYFFVNGTSLATPLTAGSAALILSARPELTPIQVRDALRNTAEPIIDSVFYPSSPNNFTGWGFIDAFHAALSFGPIFSDMPSIDTVDSTSNVAINVVSQFGITPSSVMLHYAIGASKTFTSLPMAFDSSMFFPTSGKFSVTIPHQLMGTLVRFYIDASDSGSNSYQSPPAVTGKVWQLNYGTTGVGMSYILPQTYVLKQNYPNPFNPSTKIEYDLPKREYVSLKVYNVLGELVATLVDNVQDAGYNFTTFSAGTLPSGVYFYRIVTPSFRSTKKMMLVR